MREDKRSRESSTCACPGVRHFHRVETLELRRDSWQRKVVTQRSGEEILDRGGSMVYNRELYQGILRSHQDNGIDT